MVVVEWPEEPPDDDEIERFIAASVARLERGELHYFLHDGIRAGGLSSKHRKQLAAHSRDYESLLARTMIAAAIVTPSAIVRGVVTAINWIAPPVFPQRVFATRAEAIGWLRAQYEIRVDPR